MGQLEFEGLWNFQIVRPGRQLDTQLYHKYWVLSGDPNVGIIRLEMLAEAQSRDELNARREHVGRSAAPSGKGWAGGRGRPREGRDVRASRKEPWF